MSARVLVAAVAAGQLCTRLPECSIRGSHAGAALCSDGERAHPRRPHAPGSVLWVGGMGASTSEAELIAAFAAWGLDAVHFPEGAAAAGRGFAFLTFSAPEEVRGLP
jgi:hypothetical protein